MRGGPVGVEGERGELLARDRRHLLAERVAELAAEQRAQTVQVALAVGVEDVRALTALEHQQPVPAGPEGAVAGEVHQQVAVRKLLKLVGGQGVDDGHAVHACPSPAHPAMAGASRLGARRPDETSSPRHRSEPRQGGQQGGDARDARQRGGQARRAATRPTAAGPTRKPVYASVVTAETALPRWSGATRRPARPSRVGAQTDVPSPATAMPASATGTLPASAATSVPAAPIAAPAASSRRSLTRVRQRVAAEPAGGRRRAEQRRPQRGDARRGAQRALEVHGAPALPGVLHEVGERGERAEHQQRPRDRAAAAVAPRSAAAGTRAHADPREGDVDDEQHRGDGAEHRERRSRRACAARPRARSPPTTLAEKTACERFIAGCALRLGVRGLGVDRHVDHARQRAQHQQRAGQGERRRRHRGQQRAGRRTAPARPRSRPVRGGRPARRPAASTRAPPRRCTAARGPSCESRRARVRLDCGSAAPHAPQKRPKPAKPSSARVRCRTAPSVR